MPPDTHRSYTDEFKHQAVGFCPDITDGSKRAATF